MFNGIIKNTGVLKKINKYKKNCTLEIYSKIIMSKKEIGDSISCSGVCLTLEKFNKNSLFFYVSQETLKRTIFNIAKKGDLINLEKSLKYGERVSGHFVQGHVDATGTVKKINVIGKSWMIEFKIDNIFKKYLIKKGSITINGVSLTIASINNNTFKIAVIPKTLKSTNLYNLRIKDFVNIEFDILGKYIKNFIK
jgi:riboflavin synthase